MKTKLLFVLITGIIVLINSCDLGSSKLTQFNIKYSHNITIPSNTGLNLPFDILTPETETNSESEFEINDTRKDLIEEIKLTQAKLTITSPSGQTFAFLNDIYLYLNADNLEEVLIGKLENIPESAGNSIDLELVDKDFQEYIKKDKFSLRAKTITDKITNRDVKIRIDTKFFVDAKILGQ